MEVARRKKQLILGEKGFNATSLDINSMSLAVLVPGSGRAISTFDLITSECRYSRWTL